MKVLGGLLIASACLASSSAYSEISAKDYYTIKKSHAEMVWAYLDGVGTGYSWANSAARMDGTPPLYCPPEKLAVTGDNFIRIMEDEIKVGDYKPEMPVEYLMLRGLKKAFPCR